MPIKTYGILGKTSAVLDFRNGQTTVRGTFAGGIPDPLHSRPALLTTAEPFVQDTIERDPRFGKLIKLFSVRKTKAEKEAERRLSGPQIPTEGKDGKRSENPVPALKKEAEVSEMRTFPNVTNINEAREILADLGAAAAQTINKDTTKATAKSLGVRFPNWK